MTQSPATQKPAYYAYQIRENKAADAKTKGFWTRIGAAWKNRDESITLQLECVPLDGRIVLQVPKDKDEAEAQAA